MQTLEYRFLDKSAWGPGAWQDEPDKRQWLDAESGLPCLIVRHPRHGNLCGYVGVSEGHPLFGKGYNEPDVDVEVHGGLTFSDFCVENGKEHSICHVVEPGENERVWWFGFDCAHCWDLSPGLKATLRALPPIPGLPFPAALADHSMLRETYRTFEYVTEQTEQLARQLAGIGAAVARSR